jgi:UDP-glucose 4-epimerase
VSGGAGFIGHHLVRALQDQGDEVMVIDDLSNAVHGGLDPATRVERLDLAHDDLCRPLAAWNPTVVYHLAAQVSVPRSMQDPERDLAVNVGGTRRLLEAAASAGATRVVFTSSGGAIYGETLQPATESTRPAPESYYGAHKLLAEQYVRWSGLAYAVARPSNVYGPDQPAAGEGAVIAAFVAAVRSSSSIVIHGAGTQRRDFLHVSDLVRALVMLGDRDSSGTWNISSGVSTSVLRLTALLEGITGRPIQARHGDPRSGDVGDSSMVSSRMRQLGWSPQITLEVGLRAMLTDALAAA